MAPPVYSTGNPIIDIFYILFNGISEVPVLSSPITGMLFLAGIFIASRRAGMMTVISALVGAGVATLAGAPPGLITFGLFSYTCILTGLSFWSGPFVKSNNASFLLSIFGAALASIAWMAFAHLMGDMFVQDGLSKSWAIPGFASSFFFVTWPLMLASKRFSHDIWPAPTIEENKLIVGSGNPVLQEEYKWTAKEFLKATLHGISQLFFVANWKTGIFVIVGLTLSFELSPVVIGQDRPWWSNAYTTQWDPFSPLFLAGLVALLGSGIGVAMGILTKLPTSEVRSGLHGFNQVLVMIALTSFIPFTPQALMMGILAAVAVAFVMPALQKFLGVWGIPPLAAPFVLTAWIFLMAITGFQNIPAGIGWSKP